MSRIGKKPIEIPEGVEVSVKKLAEAGYEIEIKGPKGTLGRKVHPFITVEKKGESLIFYPSHKVKGVSALWGTERSLALNMIKGVTEGYLKQLEIRGIGYKAELKDKNLVLHIGFSHLVTYGIPEGIDIKVEKNIITISGIDKEKVGKVAAEIRAMKKPEPYKGKGIRYLGETVIRKTGKKAVGAGQ